MKRTLSFLLILSLCFGMLCTTALGADVAITETETLVIYGDGSILYGGAELPTTTTGFYVGNTSSTQSMGMTVISNSVLTNYDDMYAKYLVEIAANNTPIATMGFKKYAAMTFMEAECGENHDYKWTVDEEAGTHQSVCGVCKKATVAAEHTFTYESVSDTQHKATCSECKYEKTELENHSVGATGVCSAEGCGYAETVTVKFDANGGDAVTQTLSVKCGDKVGTLPTATRTDWTFAGWWTAKEGGTEVTADTDMSLELADANKVVTLYAHWDEVAAYKVTIAPTTNGTVIAVPSEGREGDTITLAITPATGYATKSITTNPTVEVKDGQFKMPASDITVTVTFEKQQSGTTPGDTSAKPTIAVRPTSIEVLPGDAFTVNASATGGSVEWSVSDPAALTIDSESDTRATFIAENAGADKTVTITATVSGTTVSATCEVKILKSELGSIGGSTVEVGDGENKPAEAGTSSDSTIQNIINAGKDAIDSFFTGGGKPLTNIKAVIASITVVTDDAIRIDGTIVATKTQIEAKAKELNLMEGYKTSVEHEVSVKSSGASKKPDGTIKSMTFDIKVFAVVSVMNADGSNKGEVNRKDLKDIKNPVEVVIPMPTDFRPTYPAVKHTKDSGKSFWHRASWKDNSSISFWNSNGFSSFEVMALEDSDIVAEIGLDTYTSLQDAVNAVKKDQTITLYKGGLTATVNHDRPFSIAWGEGATDKDKSVKFVDRNGNVIEPVNGVYTGTASSSSGGGSTGGGSSKPSIIGGTGNGGSGNINIGETGTGFSDVASNAWYAEYVAYVTSNGLFQGVGNGLFAPNQNMNRAMMWTVLARYKGADTEGGENWYAKARTWAMEQGISDGTMALNNVTREQFVTMLWRLSGEPEAASAATFTDNASVNSWAKTAVDWAVGQGIVNGYNDGSFKPQGNATRAEVAKMLTVFCMNQEG